MTLRPMLAESIDITDLPKYISDDSWWFQNKADGHRFLVEVTDGGIVVLNRGGQAKTSGISYSVLKEFEVFDRGHWALDGELIGRTLYLFDLLFAGNLVNENSTFEERYAALALLMTRWSPDPAAVQLMSVARSQAEKEALTQAAIDRHQEGVMARHRNGVYQPGRRSTQLLKCKFTKECDAIVTAIGADGHDNVVLALLDPDNNRVVEIGRASAIGKKPKPAVGDVWEVKFLYVVNPLAPRLYQPRLMRKRTDKALHECLIHQLDHCYTDKDIAWLGDRNKEQS